MADKSKLTNEDALLAFLRRNEIPATPASAVEDWRLHCWMKEDIRRLADASLLGGRLLLVFSEEDIGPYVHDAQSD